MARRCEITGKSPRVGHNISHAHNLTKRRFNINLQRVRVWLDGKVVTMRVSTSAIRSGLVEKPPVKTQKSRPSLTKPQPSESVPVRREVKEEVEREGFFTPTSAADIIFRQPSGGVSDKGEELTTHKDLSARTPQPAEPLSSPSSEEEEQ